MRDPYEKPFRRPEPPPLGELKPKEPVQRTSKILSVRVGCDKCQKEFDFTGHASGIDGRLLCEACKT